MFRIAIGVLFLAACSMSTASAAGADWKQVAKALEVIPSAAGMSVLKRIKRCHFSVVENASFIETRSVAWPQYDAKAGQTVLQITIQLPPYKGGSAADNKPVSAVWIVDHGKASALSHWAGLLQNHSVPMGYDARMQC